MDDADVLVQETLVGAFVVALLTRERLVLYVYIFHVSVQMSPLAKTGTT